MKNTCDRRRPLAGTSRQREGLCEERVHRLAARRTKSLRRTHGEGLAGVIALLIANSLALASLLIMLASGLALIYGLRDVINFGHGAVYMLGAYLGYTVSLVGGFGWH